MVCEFRHIAIKVDNLEEAEHYYQEIFNMQLIGREAEAEDGLWYTLPPGKGWEDARRGGIELDMVALKRDAFVLALFPGKTQPGQLYILGLTMDMEEIGGVRGRLSKDVLIIEDEPDALSFQDRFGIIWQIYLPGDDFSTNGDAHGRWLEV
jgi:catechol 2,3-dioxygenase-like lactoylglutathione lyase family enzyme